MPVAKIVVVMHDQSTSLAEVLQLVGIGLTAAIASAAIIALLLNIRESRRLNQPLLRIQPIVSPKTGCYGAVIINAGDGVASGVAYVIADQKTLISDTVHHGFLRPGEAVEVSSSRRAVRGEDRRGVAAFAIARDRFGYVHDWTSAEEHGVNSKRSWKTGFRKRPAYSAIISRLSKWFPEHPGPEALEQVAVASQVPHPPQIRIAQQPVHVRLVTSDDSSSPPEDS
jgi:hypothetical protein